MTAAPQSERFDQVEQMLAERGCDAHALRAELERIAEAYPHSAALTPLHDRRAYLSEIQSLAWELRFGQSEAAFEYLVDKVAGKVAQ